jgi:NADH dehydrogenase [ubiquinone] 1 alpha subcomplex assembly factor 1
VSRNALAFMVATAALVPRPMDAMADSELILEFAAVERWWPVHDGVMGGVSQGSFETDGERGIFTGRLSLEHGGGFASIRFSNPRPDLSRFDALRLRVRGDGRTYQLRLRSGEGLDGVAWRTIFRTQKGVWEDLEFELEEFRPTFRGRIVPGAGPVPREHIHQISVMLADEIAGPFRLELDRLSGVLGAPADTAD